MAILYRPQHRKTGTTTWTDIATGTWISTTSVVDSNLVSSQSYDYQVVADNGQAESTSAIATQATLSATGESSEAMTITVLGSPTIMYASQTRGVASPTGPWDQFQLTSTGTININGSLSQGTSGVVALVYHNHDTFQENNVGGWWFWDTTLAPPFWTIFTITTAWTPVSYAANAAIGTVVGTVTTTMSDGETFTPGTNGTLTLSDNANFKLVNKQIQAKVILTQASYPLTVTATPISAGVRYGPDATASNTISVQGGALIQVPLGIHLGTWLGDAGGLEGSLSGHWSDVKTQLARTPTIVAAVMINSYQDGFALPADWGGDVSTWQSNLPVDGSVAPLLHGHFTDGSTTDSDYTGVINGTYDTALTNALTLWKNIGIKKMYFRINWEFDANFRSWGVPSSGQVTNWVNAWKRWCNVCHTWGNNNGVTMRMVWSPSASYTLGGGSFGLPVVNFFPIPDSSAVGGRYIDVIGFDQYQNGYSVSTNLGQGFTTALTSNTNWSAGTFALIAQTYGCNVGISETGDGSSFDNNNSATNGDLSTWCTYYTSLSTLTPAVPIEYIALFDVSVAGASQFTGGGSANMTAGWRCAVGTGGTPPGPAITRITTVAAN